MPPEILSFLQAQVFSQPSTEGQAMTQQESTGAIDGAFDALMAEYARSDDATQPDSAAKILPDIPDITPDQTVHTSSQPQPTTQPQYMTRAQEMTQSRPTTWLHDTSQTPAPGTSRTITASQPLTFRSGKGFSGSVIGLLAGEESTHSEEAHVEAGQHVRDDWGAWRSLFAGMKRGVDFPVKRAEASAPQNDFDDGVVPADESGNSETVSQETWQEPTQAPVQGNTQIPVSETDTQDAHVVDADTDTVRQDSGQKVPEANAQDVTPAPSQELPLKPQQQETPPIIVQKAAQTQPQAPVQEKPQVTLSETDTQDVPVVDADTDTVRQDSGQKVPEANAQDVTPAPSQESPVKPQQQETPPIIVQEAARTQPQAPVQGNTQIPVSETDTQDAPVVDGTDTVIQEARQEIPEVPAQESTQVPAKTQPQAPLNSNDTAQADTEPSSRGSRKSAAKSHVIMAAEPDEAAPYDQEHPETPEILMQEITTPPVNDTAHEEITASDNTPQITPEHDGQDYALPVSYTHEDSETPVTHRENTADIPDANIIMAGYVQAQDTQSLQPAQPAHSESSLYATTESQEAHKADRPSRTQPLNQTQAVTQQADPEIPEVQPQTSHSQSQTQTKPGHDDDSENTNVPQPPQVSGNDSQDEGAVSPARVPASQPGISRAASRNDRPETRNEPRAAPRKIEALTDFQSFFEGAMRAKRTSSRVSTQPLSLRTGTYEASGTQPQARTLRNGIVNTVRFIRADGVRKANIIVDPPALGRISVELTSSTSGVEASVKVASEQIRQIVQEQFTQLRENLAQQGVQVSEFTVDVQQDNSRQGQDSGSQYQRSHYGYTASDDDDDTETFRADLEEGLLYWIA